MLPLSVDSVDHGGRNPLLDAMLIDSKRINIRPSPGGLRICRADGCPSHHAAPFLADRIPPLVRFFFPGKGKDGPVVGLPGPLRWSLKNVSPGKSLGLLLRLLPKRLRHLAGRSASGPPPERHRLPLLLLRLALPASPLLLRHQRPRQGDLDFQGLQPCQQLLVVHSPHRRRASTLPRGRFLPRLAEDLHPMGLGDGRPRLPAQRSRFGQEGGTPRLLHQAPRFDPAWPSPPRRHFLPWRDPASEHVEHYRQQPL
ncbi:uncharacterized protein [Erythrolamprus reginae]|uniref:uncharacterized protein isoform X1 n=1 Tax=Erythrolamprus reginae TaxID=121349 RepID=UPI00396C87A7